MDALALLCTLHADGPATLKRLRARGWTSLGALLASDADDLADGLGVGAPAARRLLREARMLAGRVGLEVLDEEEAPPTSIAEPGGALRPDLGELGDPVDDPATGLDPADRALVSRIVGGAVREDETEALAPVSDEPAEDRTDDGSPLAAIDLVEQFRPPAERAEDAGVTAFELDAIAAPVDEGPEVPERVEDGPLVVPEPAAAPEPECEPEPEPEPEPAADGALFDGALPGLDAALVEDLRAEGIETLEDLAGAKSLLLTRSLGITFAQARRLQFLARREAAGSGARRRVERAPRAVESEPVASEKPLRAEPSVNDEPAEAVAESVAGPISEPAAEPVAEPAAEATVEEPASVPVPVVAELTPAPAETPDAEEPSRPTESIPEVLATDSPEPEPAEPELSAPELAGDPEPETEPVVEIFPAVPAAAAEESAPEPEERRPFWESRIFEETRDAEADSPDGERVDPSEIAPPPRFGERFARAAAEGRLRRSRAANGRTVLGWNFEIPRPSAEDLPFASLGNPAPAAEPELDREGERLASGAGRAEDSGAEPSGPFA